MFVETKYHSLGRQFCLNIGSSFTVYLPRLFHYKPVVCLIDQVYHEVSATRSRTLFDLIFWLEDHFGSHKNFGSRGVSAAFAKYEQMFNSGGKHKFLVLRN